jgi:putative addiction module killer protein
MILRKTEIFDKWFSKLKDRQAKSLIEIKLLKLELDDYFGDYKSVGDNVFEIRVHCGAGYRIYFSKRAKEIIILLFGGDKSTQEQDIKKAKIINNEED